MKPWENYDKAAAMEPKPDALLKDNPSGMYCRACRACGVSHCAHVEYCNGMERMKSNPDYENTLLNERMK
ncbi:hypothetical protein L2U69_12035 [Zavarzinia compransoris]|uniref:hypothetical protein n=1 Tax=Zavarzinia marina TaxID=2911065 RepID=UPI001F471953|nr:hypothetical protein [Zavarzinia marina]MCF4166376.1 hypothetical protein [Zavarzinia marina]